MYLTNNTQHFAKLGFFWASMQTNRPLQFCIHNLADTQLASLLALKLHIYLYFFSIPKHLTSSLFSSSTMTDQSSTSSCTLPCTTSLWSSLCRWLHFISNYCFSIPLKRSHPHYQLLPFSWVKINESNK